MKNFRRLVSYLRPYGWRFAFAALLTVVSVVGELLTPWLFGLTVEGSDPSDPFRRYFIRAHVTSASVAK